MLKRFPLGGLSLALCDVYPGGAEIGRDHGWDLYEQAYGPFHIGFKGFPSQATSVVPR